MRDALILLLVKLFKTKLRFSLAVIHTRRRQNTVKFRLFMEFLSRTLTRKVANRLVKLSLFMSVLFSVKVLFSLRVYFVCVFYEVQRVANLRKLTIYVIAQISSSTAVLILNHSSQWAAYAIIYRFTLQCKIKTPRKRI